MEAFKSIRQRIAYEKKHFSSILDRPFDFPTLTDRLCAAPGAVVKAGPLNWANQTVSRLAAKTQQALGFKFFPSQTGTVGG